MKIIKRHVYCANNQEHTLQASVYQKTANEAVEKAGFSPTLDSTPRVAVQFDNDVWSVVSNDIEHPELEAIAAEAVENMIDAIERVIKGLL
ncbi:MAG: hypothetical protein WC341_15345 [Bacteroidales bacterium]|jgi:hypothetical protein